jgi:hypothetical protein
MIGAVAKETSGSPDAIERLLLEAATVGRSWRSAPFRETGVRECDQIFLPGIDELGPAKFHAAIGLRAAVRSLGASTDDIARQHLALAIVALVKVIRREPVRGSVKRDSGRRYWMDREE